MPNSKKNKSLYSHSLLIFLIRFFSSLANLVVMYYFSHLLTPEAYGSYQNFWVHLLLTSGIASLGISLFIFTYPPDTLRYLIKQIRPVYFLSYLLFLTITSCFFVYLQKGRQSFLSLDSYIPFLFFIGYVCSVLLESMLIVIQRFRLLLTISLGYAIIFVLIHFQAAQKGFELNQLFTQLLPFLFIKIALFLPSIYKFLKQTASHSIDTIDVKRVRSLWIHLSFFNLYSVLFQWADKYVLTFIISAALSAVYFNGSVGIPFLPLAFGAVSSALLMQLNTLAGKGTTGQNINLLHYSSGLLSSVAFPVFCYLLFFGTEVITFMFSDKYLSSVPIFLCSILVIPVRSFDFVAVLQNNQKGQIINLGAALDLILAFALMYPLYILIGLPGVALSFVISTYGQCIFYLYYSGKVMRVSMWAFIPWKAWLLKLLLFGSLSFGLQWVLHKYTHTPLQSLLIAAVIIATVALVILRYEYKKQPKQS